MLTESSRHALKVVLLLAEEPAQEWVSAETIARGTGIPASYLSKIVQTLTRAGILESHRGRSGGVRLATPPNSLRLSDVIAPFDEQTGRRHCLLGQPSCSDRTACALHHAWKTTADGIAAFFGATTVGDAIPRDRRRSAQPS